jgi:Fe-Mn family superoxide dismutase
MAKIGLYGGGFKPPTKGHFEVVQKIINEYPDLDMLIVLVGKGIRDGISQDESILIWNLYKKYLPLKVRITPVSSPVGEIYSLAKGNLEDEFIWFLGERQGKEEDVKDIQIRTQHLTNKKENYPNLTTAVIFTEDTNISGTQARKYLKNQDKTGFFSLLPDSLPNKEKDEVYGILSPSIDEGRKKKRDPKKGTGKKPKGSSRRLYTDEDPKDTVGVKFSTRQDIIDTFSKKSFKAKSHARQSQIINLVHQRVRAAYNRAKDPAVKKRLKTALNYAEKRKEASKKKTQRLRKQNEGKGGLGRGNVGTRYRAIEKRGKKFYYIQDDPLGAGIRQEFGPFKTKQAALKKMGEFPPAQNYRDLTENMNKEILQEQKEKINFKRPKLNYSYTSLQPYIDKETMEEHFDKHFKGYTDKLNAELEEKNITVDAENQIQAIQKILSKYPKNTKIRNNGGGFYNHVLYFENMTPDYKAPSSNLKKMLEENFNSFSEFKEKFKEAGLGQFGSGWVFLIKKGNKLVIESYPNQDNPYLDKEFDGKILIAMDVWEHSYYLKHKSKRGNYINDFFKVVDYKVAEERLEEELLSENIDPKAQKKYGGKSAPYGSAYEPVNEIGIDLTNYDGQILPGDILRAPKGFPLGGKKLEKSLALKVIKNSREGVNRYKLTLEDPKTEKRYSVRNYEMDGEYQGKELPQWGLIRKSKKNVDEGDTYEKMAAKGKKAGNLKQGTVRKRLGIKKGEKIPLSKINKEISRLKKMDQDDEKKGVQLGDKNQKYYKALQLSKTLKTTTNVNENATYSNYIDLRQQIMDLTKHMLDQGEKIIPLPKLVFKHGDSENAKEFLGKTAYYDPNTMTIVLYTEGRHPKDIVRSFSHEMVHHKQNLEGKLDNISTTNTLEDDHLDQIEREAYEEGNMTFRNYTDDLQEKPTNEGTCGYDTDVESGEKLTTPGGIKEKKTKDPFGITAYAYELARGLEEQEEKIETKYTIYSDMDGVLTDFDARFKEFSKGISPRDYENKFGTKKFWNLVDNIGGKDFWANMDWMPDGKEYWSYIQKYDPIILTAPSMNSVSRLGKRQWRDGNLPGVKIKMASARNKPNYSKRNTILIDDREDTIAAWNAMGGIGIHHTSAANTIKKLKELGL